MRNAGRKKSWMTSSDVIINFTGCPTGTWSSLISLWPVGMLRLPHPLPADDADLESVVRRIINVKINDRAPDKHDHGQTERDHRPKNFQPELSLDGSRPFILGAAAIFDGEDDNQRKKSAQRKKPTPRRENKRARRPLTPWSMLAPGTKGNQGSWRSSALPGLQFTISIPPEHDGDEKSTRANTVAIAREADDIRDRADCTFLWQGRSDSKRVKADRWANRSFWQRPRSGPDANPAAKIRCHRNSARFYRPASKA